MWSSVRRYRGRSTREDDISINCSCITDWCFTWCGNQCAKKHEQRTSVSSQVTSDSEQSQDSKCCNFGGCCVQTTQVRSSQRPSQVLTDSQIIQADAQTPDGDAGLGEERQKTDITEDVGAIGHWAYLRRFRPRFFNRSKASNSGVRTPFNGRTSSHSRFRNLITWLQQFQPRITLAPANTHQSTTVVTSDTARGEPVNIETVWNDRGLEGNEDAWGSSPCVVFARGKCGYESFNPNCCRLLTTFSYPLSEHEDMDTEIHSIGIVTDEHPRTTYTTPYVDDVTVVRDDTEYTRSDHSQCSIEETSVTVIEVATDAGSPNAGVSRVPNDGDVYRVAQNPSKQTQIHIESGESIQNIAEIEKVGFGTNGADRIGTASIKRAVLAPIESNILTKGHQFHIPEVVLSRSSTPLPNIPEECAEALNALAERSPRKSVFRTDTVGNPQVEQLSRIQKHPSPKDPDKGKVTVDIVKYMAKSSPYLAQSSATGITDITKKSVRFKEASVSHSSTTKGRAVYIGTFKHAVASKRKVIDCLSMTLESGCVTVEETTGVTEATSNHTKANTAMCPSLGIPSGGQAAAPPPADRSDESAKGVKEYVSEYSQLCKSSVDQEREILQTVIDGVRECYKIPASLDPESSPTAGSLKK